MANLNIIATDTHIEILLNDEAEEGDPVKFKTPKTLAMVDFYGDCVKLTTPRHSYYLTTTGVGKSYAVDTVGGVAITGDEELYDELSNLLGV